MAVLHDLAFAPSLVAEYQGDIGSIGGRRHNQGTRY